jgi:hypothetical protein
MQLTFSFTDMANKTFPEDLAINKTRQLPSAEIFELSPRNTPYAVCIPVINEGERLKNQLANMREKQINDQEDILILDGGSTDGSLDPDYLRSQGIRTSLVETGPGRLSAQLRMGFAYALTQCYQEVITITGNQKDGVEAISDFIRAYGRMRFRSRLTLY